jgi:hypothetical protein
MSNKFTTINQFDKKYKLTAFGKQCNACPIFAIRSVEQFFINGQIDATQHEQNLNDAVTLYDTIDLPKYMSFDELIVFTDGKYNRNDISGYTPELINEFGYDPMFDQTRECYAVIILKNSNYITVLVKNGIYCVRDCHETEQYTFYTFDELKHHLNNVYQFNKQTIVDGVLITEYQNIEYLCMNEPYTISSMVTTSTINKVNDICLVADGMDDPFMPSGESMSSLNKLHNATNQYSIDELMAMQMQFGD